MMRTIRIGSGAGYSGDRVEPALELAEKGDIQYLVFECLGERTVKSARDVVAVASVLLPREYVRPQVLFTGGA
jgi:hypothetical protein